MPLAAARIKRRSLKGEQKDTLAAIKDNDKIVFGVKTDTRLFGLKNPSSGEIEGFDIDIAKQIAKDILGDEKKAQFKEVTSKTRIPMLQNGDIDAIVATMTITEERKRKLTFLMSISRPGNRFS